MYIGLRGGRGGLIIPGVKGGVGSRIGVVGATPLTLLIWSLSVLIAAATTGLGTFKDFDSSKFDFWASDLIASRLFSSVMSSSFFSSSVQLSEATLLQVTSAALVQKEVEFTDGESGKFDF